MEGDQDRECGTSLEQAQFGGICGVWEENGTTEGGKEGRRWRILGMGLAGYWDKEIQGGILTFGVGFVADWARNSLWSLRDADKRSFGISPSESLEKGGC